MNNTTKKYIIFGVLIAAVVGIMIFNRSRSYRLAAQLANDSIVGGGKPVLLQLGAHWCPPCRKQLPVMVELSDQQNEFLTAFLDVDKNPQKAGSYDVETIPLLIFFDADGNELARHTGFWPKNEILSTWKEL